MSEENTNSNEKVIMEAKLQNSNKPKVVKLNEEHATMDIAKNLIQDYTFLLTISAIKSLYAQVKNSEIVLNNIKKIWESRMSQQLAEETENYKKAIVDAFNGAEGNVTEEVANEIKEYMNTYCRVRDKAVELAKEGVDNISKLILPNAKENTTAPTEAAPAPTPTVEKKKATKKSTKKETTPKEEK